MNSLKSFVHRWRFSPINDPVTEDVCVDCETLPDNETISFYERIYFLEIEMREKIVARMQVPLAVLVPLLGVHAFFVGSADKSRLDWSGFFFWLSLLISLFWTLRSGHLFFQVLSGHTYRFIPFLHELERYRKNCIEEFKRNPEADKWLNEWVSMTCKSHLTQHYILCASHNSQLNADRSNRSWKAHTLLLRGALGTGLAALLFLVFDLRETTIHQVKLIDAQPTQNMQVELVNSIGKGLDFSMTYLTGSENESGQ